MAGIIKNELDKFYIAHLHDYRGYPSLVLHHYAVQYGVPYVLQAHGSLATFFHRGLLKTAFDRIWGNRLLSDAARVVATTSMEVQQYELFGVASQQIDLIPNGLDIREFENLPPRGRFRCRMGIPADRRIVLFVGRMHKTKGLDFLLDAFALVRRDLGDVNLLIAGPNDGYFAAMKRKAAQLGIWDRILCVGTLRGRDKLSAFVDADVFVLPSSYEVFGLVAFEAMMCYTPVVVTDTCAIASLIADNKLGGVVSYDNISEMSDKLCRVLTHRKEIGPQVSRARAYVSENLSWDSIVRLVENLYEEILGERGTK